jgi:HAE1 family hydrophobic/amphiphilic exporter-1
VVFLEGIAAQLFKDQALTVSFSLIASLAVSLTLIPMMAALSGGSTAAVDPEPASGGETKPVGRVRRVLRAIFFAGPAKLISWIRIGGSRTLRFLAFVLRPITKAFDGAMGFLLALYPRVLRRALHARLAVLALVAVLFALSIALVPRLGLDLIPSFTQGEFHFQVQLPEGTPLDSTDRFMTGLAAVLEDQPNVASYSAIIGGAGLSLSNTGTEGENTARLQVQMKPDTTPEDEEAVITAIRQRLETSQLARFKFERPTYFTFRTPIEVEVYSDSIDELQKSTVALKKAVEGVPGFVDVKTSAELGNPELQVTFNREQLAQLGLDLSQVAATVRGKVQGTVATRFTQGDREIDIVVRSVEVGAASVGDIREMIIGSKDDRPIFLSSVADIQLVSGPSEIRRIGQKRAAVIAGNLSGRDMGAVAADVRSVIRATALPAGVTASLSGQEEEMQRSMRSLMLAMALAIFLVYLVMASQFESFLHPFVIIFTLPLAAIGVVIALALAGRSVSIVAMIGVVMLAGIVVNNAIVLIDAVNQLRRKGMGKEEALVEAGLNRMRPILMTSLTTVLGLLPMALGLGEGAELRAPLAVTVIGGLTVATMLTLIVIPVVYSLLDRQHYAADESESPIDEEAEAIPPASAALVQEG